MRSLIIVVATACLIFLGSCNRKASHTEAEVDVTVEIQHHCIIRALEQVFEPGGMQDVRGRWRDRKSIAVIFDGFPHQTYPEKFGERQLIQVTQEEVLHRVEDGESLSWMYIGYLDRRPEGVISVYISTYGYSWDDKQKEGGRVHGEGVTIEFKPADGGLDNGTITFRMIE